MFSNAIYFVWSILKCICPRCRKGRMFQNPNPYKLTDTMKMNETCAVCKQVFSIEVGFYYGAGFISYALALFVSMATFLIFWALIGFSLDDNRFFYWLLGNAIFLIILQPYLMRLARSGWLALFVSYDPNWENHPPIKPERINFEQENNW